MGRGTFSLLSAALLVSLLTHRLPVSSARHAVVLKVDDGLKNIGDTNLAKDSASASADDSGVKKGFDGRKLISARNMEEIEAVGVKGDQQEKDDASRPKPQESQTAQQGLAGSAAAARPARSAAAAAVSRSWTVGLRTAAWKRPDPATEMYDMLRRDYASRPSRRRPIHNGMPLQNQEP